METKNFLFVSLGGLIGDIAWQVQKEGHAVKFFIEAENERDIADGFVPKTTVWRSDVGWADVIVFDDTLGQGARADEPRQQGKRVGGGTAYTDRLEDDRSFGQEELRKAGVNILPYREFEDSIRPSSTRARIPDMYYRTDVGDRWAEDHDKLLSWGYLLP
jgi:phosphoribosylamine---glycine ligase